MIRWVAGVAVGVVVGATAATVGLIVWAAYETHYKPKKRGQHHE